MHIEAFETPRAKRHLSIYSISSIMVPTERPNSRCRLACTLRVYLVQSFLWQSIGKSSVNGLEVEVRRGQPCAHGPANATVSGS